MEAKEIQAGMLVTRTEPIVCYLQQNEGRDQRGRKKIGKNLFKMLACFLSLGIQIRMPAHTEPG